MRLAVVQMLPTGSRDEDSRHLRALVERACADAARAIVLPRVPSLLGADLPPRPADCGAGVAVLGAAGLDSRAVVSDTPFGRAAELFGDDAIDPALHAPLLEAGLHALVLRAEPESSLQAEAILELAVAYSTSIAGLVVLAAASALDDSGDAYGGSAIVQHGEILAEAVEPDEILYADIDPPVALQEPISPPPEPPLILRQRLAHHRGGKAEVEWLADLD